MKLKTATMLVIIALAINLIIDLASWVAMFFSPYHQWWHMTTWFVRMLLFNVPMIIFFIVLFLNQRGQQNGPGPQ